MPASPEVVNSCKQALDKSRKDVYNAIMYLLHPDDYHPHTSDAELTRLYEVWCSAARATDIVMNAKWHPVAYGPMITMPPDEPEYKVCRRMAAAVIKRSLYDENIATHSLYDAVHHVYLNAKVCALHPVTCACHYSNGWTGTNETLLKTLRSELEHSNFVTVFREAVDDLKKPPLDDDFVKNLFQTVQSVKFDSMCPHGEVVYSCMECSH